MEERALAFVLVFVALWFSQGRGRKSVLSVHLFLCVFILNWEISFFKILGLMDGKFINLSLDFQGGFIDVNLEMCLLDGFGKCV